MAVLKLAGKIDFSKYDANKVNKVCLASDGDEPDASKCVVMGWGATSSSSSSSVLQEVNLPMLDGSSSQCHAHGQYNQASIICAGKPNGNSCNGDSGGPYICPTKSGSSEWLQYGIVSYGARGCKNSASFYTRVSKFISWIRPRAES